MLFEALHTAELNVLNEAVYLLGLRFHERPYIAGWRKLLRVKPGGSDEAVALAARVIEDIEEAEGKSFEDLTEQEAAPYRRCIHNITDRRRAEEDPPTPEEVEQAQQILEEMRRMYGGPGGTPLVEAGSTD
jgi:hypothetical protein